MGRIFRGQRRGGRAGLLCPGRLRDPLVSEELGGVAVILSGKSCAAVEARAADLGIEHVIQGSSDKLADLRTLAPGWPCNCPKSPSSAMICPIAAHARPAAFRSQSPTPCRGESGG
jgi:hypothetical protein